MSTEYFDILNYSGIKVIANPGENVPLSMLVGIAGQSIQENFLELANRTGNNYAVSGSPTINNDQDDTAAIGQNFTKWSRWHDTWTDISYVCLDPSTGAAVWKSSAGEGLKNVVDDTTPQLGGDLDINGNSIVSTSNGDIEVSPDGSGDIKLNSEVDVNSVVNTSAGLAPLRIESNSSSRAIYIEENGAGTESWAIGVDGDGNLSFFDSVTTERITFLDNGNVGIGVSDPSTDLHIENSANPTIRINESATDTSYFELQNVTSTQSSISHTTNSGSALIDIDPIVSDGTSSSSLRFFRTTNTTGAVSFTVFKGDGTGTIQHFFRADGTSYVNIDSGSFGVGISTPDYMIDINGAIGFRELSSDPGNPDEGASVVWMGDGTGTGDDGDVYLKTTANSTTNTIEIIDHSRSEISNVKSVTALGNLGATETIDWSNSTIFTGTLDSNVTITFSNEIAGSNILLYLEYDGSAQRTITWSDVDKWDGGSAPAAPSSASETMVVNLIKVGSTVYGSATIFS